MCPTPTSSASPFCELREKRKIIPPQPQQYRLLHAPPPSLRLLPPPPPRYPPLPGYDPPPFPLQRYRVPYFVNVATSLARKTLLRDYYQAASWLKDRRPEGLMVSHNRAVSALEGVELSSLR